MSSFVVGVFLLGCVVGWLIRARRLDNWFLMKRDARERDRRFRRVRRLVCAAEQDKRPFVLVDRADYDSICSCLPAAGRFYIPTLVPEIGEHVLFHDVAVGIQKPTRASGAGILKRARKRR